MPDDGVPFEPKVPANIAPYVDVLGVDGAVEFLLTFGGAQLYLSQNPQGRSRLEALVGADKARRLALVSEGLPRRIPTAKPWIAAVLRAKGLPVSEIARRLHASDVSVRAWLKKPGARPADSRQLPLL